MKILRVPLLVLACAAPLYAAEQPAASPSPLPSPGAEAGLTLKPFAERLENARTVKVMTSVLGLELGDDIATARRKLDKLSEGGKPTKDETEEDEGEPNAHKILWQLKGTDYAHVFAKTNEEGRISNFTVFRREGKELPFAKIGDVKKAPIANERVVAWDVVRPKKPLIRVVAEGADKKAKTITIFVVKRGAHGRDGESERD